MKEKKANKVKIKGYTVIILAHILALLLVMTSSIIAIIKNNNFNAIWFLVLSAIWGFLFGLNLQRFIFMKRQENNQIKIENFIKEVFKQQIEYENTEPFEEFK